MPKIHATDGGRIKWNFWFFQIAFWLAIGLVMMILIKTFHPMESAWQTVTSRVGTGFILTYGLSRCYQLPLVAKSRSWQKVMLIIVLTLMAWLIGTLFWMYAPSLLHIHDSLEENQFLRMGMVRFVMFFFWDGIYFGLEKMEESHEQALAVEFARGAARESELKQLKAQLNPHFLFNSLNTLLAKEQNQEAQKMTQHLADYLRFSLADSQNLEPLDRELGALEDYLAVQRIRFGADLECSIECDIAARSLLVPPMLIQPLLENAFKYGPLTSAMPLRVEVKAVVVREGEECSLLISVANTGRWRPEQRKEPEQPGGLQFLGTGLTNLRKRLVLLLGVGSTLQIKKEPAWVKVEIRVPIQDVATIEKQAIEAT